MKRVMEVLRPELEASGLPWSIDNGGKHLKLRLGGRLIGVLPKGSSHTQDPRATKNLVAQIRRAAREMRG